MVNLTKELCIAIQDVDLDHAIDLLNNGAPMIIGHFVLATQLKLYEIYTFHDPILLTWFLEHGADPNKRCHIRNCTPLSHAVEAAPFAAIKTLFQHSGSATNTQGQLLHYAAQRSHADNLAVLTYIYNTNPDANAANVNKLLDQDCAEEFAMNFRAGLGTPLHYAALAGSLDSVRFLVQMDADPWVLDPYRRTALSLAVYADHEHVVRFLRGIRDMGRLGGG